MSQEQPQRPQDQEAIKYADVFPAVFGELASKPIAPQDAAMMQTAEQYILGQTQKGGPAAIMQSAATFNEQAGHVGHTRATDIVCEQGVTVTETGLPGSRVITESIAGQVLGEYTTSSPIPATAPVGPLDRGAITIGEVLEATAITAADKPVDGSDAAAIQVAEMRATGSNVISPTGVAAAAQHAASINARLGEDEVKTKLGEVLEDAGSNMPADKGVTMDDADGVIGAELRNNPEITTYQGGVADLMDAAARMNQQMKMN